MPPAAAPAFDAAARGAAPAATSAAAPAPPAGAAPAGGDASVAPPRRRRRVAVQKEADTVTTVTTVLLGAVTLAVGASLVEAGLRAWRAAARRRRREKERKARGSQDTTPPNTPPPLRVDTRMHQPRGLPEGEYYRSPRRSREGSGYAPGSPMGSAPPSPERGWRPAPPELRHLPSIPSAQDLCLPEGADEWAAAVSAKEPWTQVEPWRTLWAASAAAEDREKVEAASAAAKASAAANAAAKAAREAAEDARWSEMAARQDAARNAALPGATSREASPPRAGWAADVTFAATSDGAGAAQTSAELAAITRYGTEAALAERGARERLEDEHAMRVRMLMGKAPASRF